MNLQIRSISPAEGAEFVAVNTPIVITFNRDVQVLKPVIVRCMDCQTPAITITPVCSGTQCVIERGEEWEANTTYYLVYDAMTFRAAWESYYLALPDRFPSFSTAANACSMEFIAAEWNSMCSCISTGTHCQCNCGATAILKAF